MAVQPGSIDRQALQTGRAVSATDVQEEPRSRGRLARNIAFVALLLLFTVLFLYPFLWLVSASLKTTAEVFDGRLIPASFHPENYSNLIQQQPVVQWTINSILVSFAAAKTHCSFFVQSPAVMEHFAAELEGFDTAKGTIRFKPDKAIPAALVKKIVQGRIFENEQITKAKSK